MERRMFETSVAQARPRSVLTLPASMTVHGLVVAAAIALPLLGASELPDVIASPPRVFFEPQAPPVVPPPPPASDDAPPRPVPRDAESPRTNTIVQPMVIPNALPELDLDDDLGVPGGDPNGVPGGVPGGIPGGLVGGLLPSGMSANATTPQRPGGRVLEPRKVKDVAPVYPGLARQAGVQGDVILECVIDVHGRVVEAAVVSGSPLLSAAALDAARQWVYTPTLLNGMPVPILLRAVVRFRLGHA